MRCNRRVFAAVCCFAAVMSTASAAPVTEVVFGNLGADGSGGLSSTNTDMGPGAATTLALAQGFTTGSGASPLVLTSVTIGAFTDGSASRTVSIYSNSSNAPGTVLFTSSPTVVSGQAKYTFNFTGASLSAGTSYWVVPDFSVDWSWYLEANETDQPTEQNASGYAYLGTKRQATSNPGVWVNSTQPYSLSVQAVPEPSTYALAAMGLAGVALFRRRRLKSA